MRADLIERLRTGVVFDNTLVGHGYRIGDADELMAEAADALASQDPVAWQWRYRDWAGSLHGTNKWSEWLPGRMPETGRPVHEDREERALVAASPVEPVVAAKAEAEGWRDLKDCPSDGRPVLIDDGGFVDIKPADGSWWLTGTKRTRAFKWMPVPLPAAPTGKGDGQP